VHAREFQVRPARPADIASLFRIKRELTHAAGAEATLRATERDWLRDAFGSAPHFQLFVAESGGDIVGMTAFTRIYMTALGGMVLVIQDLFVAPEYRKRSVGRALVAEVAAVAIAESIPLIELNVAADNPARKFYRRLGFQHLKECLTYAVGGGGMLDLALSAQSAPTTGRSVAAQ
jgi:ribosomal protein S18 acetylase RimI-like enzyme